MNEKKGKQDRDGGIEWTREREIEMQRQRQKENEQDLQTENENEPQYDGTDKSMICDIFLLGNVLLDSYYESVVFQSIHLRNTNITYAVRKMSFRRFENVEYDFVCFGFAQAIEMN